MPRTSTPLPLLPRHLPPFLLSPIITIPRLVLPTLPLHTTTITLKTRDAEVDEGEDGEDEEAGEAEGVDGGGVATPGEEVFDVAHCLLGLVDWPRLWILCICEGCWCVRFLVLRVLLVSSPGARLSRCS